MESISQFINGYFLPGVMFEIGLLCCACVKAEPELAGCHLINKILKTTISTMKKMPSRSLGKSSKVCFLMQMSPSIGQQQYCISRGAASQDRM
jgi:hypothetical protein